MLYRPISQIGYWATGDTQVIARNQDEPEKTIQRVLEASDAKWPQTITKPNNIDYAGQRYLGYILWLLAVKRICKGLFIQPTNTWFAAVTALVKY